MQNLEQHLGGPVVLDHCDGRMGWPNQGVYFFFQPGEFRSDSGYGPRVVRVGTHAVAKKSRTTLWNRLIAHRGNDSDGGGNHRGSVFRELVGQALIARYNKVDCRSWGMGNSANAKTRLDELPLEQMVSAYIRNMPFLWLAVPGESRPDNLRSYIEKNCIALLSNFEADLELDKRSVNWLGQHAPSEKVEKSGLWNRDYVEADYEPNFLSVFEELIEKNPPLLGER